MRLLYSSPFSAGSLTFFLPKGSYGSFQIAYRGTNGATAKTRADLGNVQLTYNGNPIVNVDAELLSFLNDLKGGFSTFTSTANSTLNAQINVPCGRFGDNNNSYSVQDKDKVYFKLDFPNLTNITGTVYIYAVPKLGIQNYLYCLTSRNVVAGGAGVLSDVHRLPNVSEIYLKNTSIVSSIQIVRDNQTIVDGLREDIQAFSDFVNQVEASNSIIEIPMNISKDVREVLSQEILYKYSFSSGGTLQQYFAYNVLTPQQAVISASEINAEVQKKIQLGVISVKDLPKPNLGAPVVKQVLSQPTTTAD
jgi:hypothetical protein